MAGPGRQHFTTLRNDLTRVETYQDIWLHDKRNMNSYLPRSSRASRIVLNERHTVEILGMENFLLLLRVQQHDRTGCWIHHDPSEQPHNLLLI